MKENSDGNDTNVGSIGNSIEEDIKILEEFKTNGYSILLMKYGDRIKTNFKLAKAIEHILSNYKRVLKENEILKEEKEQAWEEWNNLEQGSYGTEQKLKQQIKESQKENEELRVKWDKDTHILQNKLDYANADRIDLAQQNKELRKENEELNNRCRNLDKEAQAYLEELAGDNTLTRRTIKQLQEENEELKKDYYNVINKIENKIDILDIAISECIYIDDDDKAYKKAFKKDKLCLLNQKRALQELLEGGQS